jgi:hypothetical protein
MWEICKLRSFALRFREITNPHRESQDVQTAIAVFGFFGGGMLRIVCVLALNICCNVEKRGTIEKSFTAAAKGGAIWIFCNRLKYWFLP